MSIPFSLLAKTLGGVAAIAAPVATSVYYKDNIYELFVSSKSDQTKEKATSDSKVSGNSSDQKPTKEKKLTKFDQGLIDYLENGGDIQFKVIKGESGDTDLTESDLVFSEGNLTITAQVKVSVNKDSSTNVDGTLTDATGDSVDAKAKKETLQKLNNGTNTENGTPWTWICEIQFTSEDRTTTSIEQKTKEKILKGTDKGLFGILKNSSSSEKTTKINFIKNCAEVRDKTTEINSSNEVKTPKEKATFEFQKKSEGTDLVPKNETKFNKWFPAASATT